MKPGTAGLGTTRCPRVSVSATTGTSLLSAPTGLFSPAPAQTGLPAAWACSPAQAFSFTVGESATFTQTCTCGEPRKYHTKAGPSSRQQSQTPS